MRFPYFFAAAGLVALAIALPQSNLEIRTDDSELGKLASRALAGDITVGGSGGAAFGIGGDLTFRSGGLLAWNGIIQFGYRGVGWWSNNFIGACHDFGIFVKAFSGLADTFEKSKLSWDHSESAITKFGADFAVFSGLLLNFGGFGKIEGGLETFKTYMVSLMKNFELFFRLIITRFGVITFQKSLVFGQFHIGFKYIFKFCFKIGIKFHAILESVGIDFSIFEQAGFDLQGLIA